MKEFSLWNVDDVDDDTRELALNAAQKAGLTLGSWIDRAIKNSTGLTLDELNPIPSTTNSERSLDDRGEKFKAVEPANLDPNASLPAPGNHATPDNLFDGGKQHPADVSTNIGLQVDPEERFGVTVEPVATLGSRRWPILPGLLGAGVPCIVLAAATVVIGAGILIYDIGFTGSDEQNQPSTTIEGKSALGDRTSALLTPGDTYLGDTPAPSEPGVIEMLTAAAEQGDVNAQYDLATRYLHGNTVAQDLQLAIKWLERAASQGMASAQYLLGVIYDDGTGVKADPNRAAMWYTRAASQGHPASQHALDQLNAAGRGAEQNEASAIVLLQQAARVGNAEAQFFLAERYEVGRGVQRNAGRAAELYASAAAKGYSAAVARREMLTTAAEANSVGTEKATSPAKPTLAPAVHDSRILDKDGIAEAQRLLARFGFKPGPVDGILGRRTVRGIKQYQSSAGLPDDGKATSSLLRELRKLARHLSTKTSPTR